MDDDAIIITRSLDPTKFEKPSAREVTIVTVRGQVMLPRWARACDLIPDGPAKKAVLFD
jgi:hypothetical protein